MKKSTLTVLIVSLAMTLVSCGSKINKAVGILDLKYNCEEQKSERSDLTIAFVGSQFVDKSRQSEGTTPMYAAMRGYGNGVGNINIDARFASEYQPQLIIAFNNGFQELISNKGFNLTGPFESFDDMTYGEKKNGYLALIPKLNITINKKASKRHTQPLTDIYTEEGVIQVTGELRVDLIEPVTKEKILSRRINLSDLNIVKNYKYEKKLNSSVWAMFLSASVTIEDSMDKAITDAINDFYATAMAKITKSISSEELLSYRPQVEKLKELKRF